MAFNEGMSEARKRSTALKLSILDLQQGKIASQNPGDSSKAVRVNVIGNVIDKFVSEGDKKYAAITIDDASSQIRVKTFGEDIQKLQGIEIGDTIVVIGSARLFNDELYILPEILRRVDPKWLLVRKYEVEKKQNTKNFTGGDRISEQLKRVNLTEHQKDLIEGIIFQKKPEGKTTKERILDVLKQESEGMDVDRIIMAVDSSVENINSTIQEMLENAEIFEPKPGRIRLL